MQIISKFFGAGQLFQRAPELATFLSANPVLYLFVDLHADLRAAIIIVSMGHCSFR